MRCGREIRKGSDGYLWVFYPCHPNNFRGWFSHHRAVMELFLNRYLEPGEIVHHINDIKDDNRIDNLELITRSGHVSCHFSGEKNPMFGKHHSEETKHRISIAKTGKYLSEEHKKKIGKTLTNRQFSEEHKKKLSEVMTGKRHTEETKRKLSELRKKRLK
jgi:hypothetical protein